MLVRTILFITSLGLLTGCMNASWEVLSSKLESSAALKPAYKPSDIVEIRWKTSGGSVTPDYLRLETSSDDGATWTSVETQLVNDGEYDWNISTMTAATYKVRLIGVIKEASETIDLGSFLLDDQVPVAGANQTISVTEDTITPFTINTPTENDQYHIEFITTPTKGALTGCVNGSNVLACIYTPDVDNDVDDSFTYKVVDRAGNESAVATVTLDMQPVNDVPVITTLACPSTIGENYNYSCTIAATDVDLPSPLTLTYKLDPTTSCGPWLSINAASGVVSGIPGAAEVGTACQVDAYAEDDVTGESARFSWTISIENSAPIINVTGGPYSVTEDAALAVVIPGANISSIEEGGGSTYSLATPTTMGDHCEDHAMAPTATNYTIDPTTGEFSFRPAADYQGVCYIRVGLTDSVPSTGYAEIPITVDNTQDAPVVAAALTPCSTAATEDVLYNCTIAVTDPDPENIGISRDVTDTCSWLNATPSGDGRTVTIEGTPDDTHFGPCTLAIRATDPQSATDMKSITVTVANAEPTLTIGTPTVLTEDDSSFSSLVEVLSDANVASLDEGQGTYSLVYTGLTGTACNNASVVVTPATDFVINPATGAVSIMPSADYYGTCYAKIQFDDGNGAGNSVVEQEIAIVVNAVNDAPTITAIPTTHEILLNPTGTTLSNFSLTVDIGPANENAQTLELICTNSNTARLTVDCAQTRTGDGNLTVNLTATAGLDTSAVVTVKVKDSGGGTDESAVATINVSMTDAVVLAPIAADTLNYNIYSQASSQYNATVAGSTRTFVVTVNAAVKVSSNDPALPAMRTGGLATGARVRLINNGQIIGASGAGGLAPSGASGALRMGQHGGTALKVEGLYNNVTILNNGVIYGGGGGGGRGGTDNLDAGAGGTGGAGEGPISSAVAGTTGASAGGAGGAIATGVAAGATPAGNYMPGSGVPQTNGSAGQGGSSCKIGGALANNFGEGAKFGRGGFGAGFGGGAGACSTTYAGGGGGGHYGGGGGAGGLSDLNDAGLETTDVNGYNGGNGGAAIEVPTSVVSPGDINIVITPGGGSQIAGCVWNDISATYLTDVVNNSDIDARTLTFSPSGAEDVNAPTGIKFWNNGRGNAYR
ncbi:Ig-like domain-containing protein [Bdellovibrio bacteriovorus]|uniref:Ig-like domain-containing protein n=1 Tax=Bdellovibrio TaxID=958 RepID=UPI0035A8EDE9